VGDARAENVGEKKQLRPGEHFYRAVGKLLLNPGSFYGTLSEREDFTSALLFLLPLCAIYSVLSGMLVPERKMFFSLIFFLNAFSMPFLTAFVLYLVTLWLRRDVLTYRSLFVVTAYANVTLLAAWIPGVAWMAGIWKFCLIGLGLKKVGAMSGRKAFLCLLAAVAALLILIQFLRPILKQ